MEDEHINVIYNNKILNCIINICESHLPKYNHIRIEDEILLKDDYFSKSLQKYFTFEEIKKYKGKEQIIHDYKQFENNNLFYISLLDDFKLYMCNILLSKKRFVL